MYIPRELEETLKKYLKVKEILAVLGPRQSGKTTLLAHLLEQLPGSHRLSFDDRETLTLFEQDPKAFIEQHISPYQHVLIDEVQYAQDSGKTLKYIYDTCSTKLLISGSSASELSLQSVKFLVGRVFVFYLYPLSFSEFLRQKNEAVFHLLEKRHVSLPVLEQANKYLEEFILYGGYPRVVLSSTTEEKRLVLRNIYNTYFLREVKEILQLPDDYKLSLLLKGLTLQIGGIANYGELAQLSGFSYAEVRKYLNILEKTFICAPAKNYHTNKRTELVKSPKFFFFDTGFRNAVIQHFSKHREDRGQLYENFLFTELVKQGFTPGYWRTKAKAEVDFIVERENKPVPLEVKSMEAKLSRSFQSFVETYHPTMGFLFSLTTIGRRTWKGATIKFLPLAQSMLLRMYLR